MKSLSARDSVARGDNNRASPEQHRRKYLH
jgi:hypothetical protein